MSGPVPHTTPAPGWLSVRPVPDRSRKLTRLLRLLILLLVACPVVMAMTAFDTPSLPTGAAILCLGDMPPSDDTPRFTRSGSETDDLREAVPGPNPRFGPVRLRRAGFVPSEAERVETLRDPPPDRPPRSVA